MRKSLISAILCLGTMVSAHAAEPLAPVQQQLFACNGHNRLLTHVAFNKGSESCCANGSGCAEALSTTILAKPHGRSRT
jgi:hypothetical protein